MNRTELLDFHSQITRSARALMEKKNTDYSDHDDESHNVFGNLDLVELLFQGEITTELGIIVRMADKLARLANGVRHDLKVTDESLTDTGQDLINYTILLLAKVQTRNETQPRPIADVIQEKRRALGIGLQGKGPNHPSTPSSKGHPG